MKILLINKFHYKRGGSETYYFAQAEALKAKGHTVLYFAMQDSKNEPCEQSNYFVSNVNYNKNNGLISKIKLGIKIFYSFEAKKNIEKLIRDEKPDIAHIGLLHRQITFSVVDVLKKYNIPVVMTMHDLIFACPNYTMLNSSGEICENCITKGVSSCITGKCIKNSKAKSILGAAEAQFLRLGKYYNKVDLYIAECSLYKSLMEKSKCTTSPIIHMSNFLPAAQKYIFKMNYENYILYFGRFSREKGVLTLIKAHELMQAKYKMKIVGAGPCKNEIEAYIKENHINNIEFLGAIYGEHMEEIIEKARVVVVPSEWYENCPYALLQSIAKGKVIVASRIGGLPELVEDGVTGYLFQPGNKNDLAQKITQVMEMDKVKYENMSNNALKKARNEHYWEDYIDKLVQLYERLLCN